MNQQRQELFQQSYVPAVAMAHATLRYSLPRLPVALQTEPDRICGFAQRVGYTGNQDTDLAIYRLKIKAVHNIPTITLPNLFVIENGVFVDYEQWRTPPL